MLDHAETHPDHPWLAHLQALTHRQDNEVSCEGSSLLPALAVALVLFVAVWLLTIWRARAHAHRNSRSAA